MLQLEGLDKYKRIANDIRLPVLLNLAACKLKRMLHHEADALCSEVLEADATSVKALFRRGSARRAMGNDDGAREDLTKCAPSPSISPCARRTFVLHTRRIPWTRHFWTPSVSNGRRRAER